MRDHHHVYLVQISDPRVYGGWRKIRVDSTYTDSDAVWDVTCPFGSVEDAVEGVEEWRCIMRARFHEPGRKSAVRVVDKSTCRIMWQENTPAGERGATPNMDNPIQLEKPLVLKRGDVIAKLNENLKKEQDKRKEAEKKEADARNDFRQFLLDHEEQVVNYVAACFGGGSWKLKLERVEQSFDKDEQYKTPESKPGRLESELEKFVRVLGMGAEDTIEVKPTQAVYDLL